MKNERIDKVKLQDEIKLALKDYFVADIFEQDSNIIIRFLNGKKFRISIEEE